MEMHRRPTVMSTTQEGWAQFTISENPEETAVRRLSRITHKQKLDEVTRNIPDTNMFKYQTNKGVKQGRRRSLS